MATHSTSTTPNSPRHVKMATKPQLAFIRRYSCLYTRDLTKKAKAWHDGYLVFHHLNAKMVLLSEKFVILDECYFRAPGLDTMRDIPKPYVVPSDTKVSFEKHIATLDNAVFEEEKDISEVFQKKKRKLASELDDFVDSDDDSADTLPRSTKRPHTSAPSAARNTTVPPGARPGWIYRIENDTAESPKATPSITRGDLGNSQQARFPSHQVTPMRPLNKNTATRSSLSTAPRSTTPFKAPSFLNTGPNSSPVPSRPSSVSRRTLGSTRPSSRLARQTLQAEWSKYADQLPTCASRPKGLSSNTSSRFEKRPAQSEEERAAHLEKVRNQAEPEIVPVHQKRRLGEEGDPSSWLFG